MVATVNTGDCLAWLRSMPDNSVDSIVTDPPYGLSNIKPQRITEAITAWATGDRESVPDGRGFMGKAWDSFVPPPAVWDECLRVLKPGGHLVAFAGSRTHDLMGLSIRMAGFEIRDGLAWLYGSGFPKSMDVSKAIDKSGGVSPVESSLVLRAARERSGMSREDVAAAVGCTASSVRDWEDGRARATGFAVEYITTSPAYRDKLAELLGYTDDERIITGSTTRRIGDGTVMALGHSGAVYSSKPVTPKAAEWSGWRTALKPAFEPVTLARKPLDFKGVNVLEVVESSLREAGVSEEITWTRGSARDAAKPGRSRTLSSTGVQLTAVTSAARAEGSVTLSAAKPTANDSERIIASGARRTPTTSAHTGEPTLRASEPKSSPHMAAGAPVVGSSSL